MPFRLPHEQMRRLEKLSQRRGQTKQAFVEGAVFAEMTAEEGKRGPVMKTASTYSEPSSSPTFSGGLAELLKEQNDSSNKARAAETSTPGQVIVHNNLGSTGGNQGDLDRLAAFVLKGRDFERTHRLHYAVRIIQETTSDDNERKVLAARLDELISSKEKSQPAKEGIFQTAKVTFDKLADLLR